jgi:hypothetical protein
MKNLSVEETEPFALNPPGSQGVSSTPDGGSMNIENESVRDNLNALLNGVTRSPSVTPYMGLERIRKVLSMYHINLPAYSFHEGNAGSSVFACNQFGDRFGMTDDAEVVTKNLSKFSIYFEYTMADSGLYDIYCEVVDQEELEDIVTDREEEELEEATIEAGAPETPIPRPNPHRMQNPTVSSTGTAPLDNSTQNSKTVTGGPSPIEREIGKGVLRDKLEKYYDKNNPRNRKTDSLHHRDPNNGKPRKNIINPDDPRHDPEQRIAEMTDKERMDAHKKGTDNFKKWLDTKIKRGDYKPKSSKNVRKPGRKSDKVPRGYERTALTEVSNKIVASYYKKRTKQLNRDYPDDEIGLMNLDDDDNRRINNAEKGLYRAQKNLRGPTWPKRKKTKKLNELYGKGSLKSLSKYHWKKSREAVDDVENAGPLSNKDVYHYHQGTRADMMKQYDKSKNDMPRGAKRYHKKEMKRRRKYVSDYRKKLNELSDLKVRKYLDIASRDEKKKSKELEKDYHDNPLKHDKAKGRKWINRVKGINKGYRSLDRNTRKDLLKQVYTKENNNGH